MLYGGPAMGLQRKASWHRFRIKVLDPVELWVGPQATSRPLPVFVRGETEAQRKGLGHSHVICPSHSH